MICDLTHKPCPFWSGGTASATQPVDHWRLTVIASERWTGASCKLVYMMHRVFDSASGVFDMGIDGATT